MSMKTKYKTFATYTDQYLDHVGDEVMIRQLFYRLIDEIPFEDLSKLATINKFKWSKFDRQEFEHLSYEERDSLHRQRLNKIELTMYL